MEHYMRTHCPSTEEKIKILHELKKSDQIVGPGWNLEPAFGVNGKSQEN
jgi:hypothetical protein